MLMSVMMGDTSEEATTKDRTTQIKINYKPSTTTKERTPPIKINNKSSTPTLSPKTKINFNKKGGNKLRKRKIT